jgi:hypothetical protein
MFACAVMGSTIARLAAKRAAIGFLTSRFRPSSPIPPRANNQAATFLRFSSIIRDLNEGPILIQNPSRSGFPFTDGEKLG